MSYNVSSFPHIYMRQSTADSASSDSLDVGWNMCKRNIEEEEAEALAKVRSMVVEQVPHPPLSGLTPPTPEVLIHVQPTNKDGKNKDVRTIPEWVWLIRSLKWVWLIRSLKWVWLMRSLKWVWLM